MPKNVLTESGSQYVPQPVEICTKQTTDVAPNSGQVLEYNGANWSPADVDTDNAEKIRDKPVASTAVGGTGRLLCYDGSNFVGIDLGPGLASGVAGDELRINPGEGLNLASNKVAVDGDAVAGSGLVGSGHTVGVGQGSGIAVDSNQVTFNAGQAAGGGLSGSGHTLSVDGGTVAGSGLSGSGNTVSVGQGSGIVVNSHDVAFDASAVAGSGLTASGHVLSLDASAAAGTGLSASGGSLGVRQMNHIPDATGNNVDDRFNDLLSELIGKGYMKSS